MLQSEGSLSLTFHSAFDMVNVEMMGKQDAYCQFSLNFKDKNSFQRTFTHKNCGKNASWNQSFEIPLAGEPELYVEVFDEEKGVDEVIGFAAIPINQVVESPGGSLNGLFEIFTVSAKPAGTLHITLTARGYNSPPGGCTAEPIQARSYINEEHQQRIKSMRNKAIGTEIGTAVLGGALAIGAGFLGYKAYHDHEKKEAQEQAEREEFERQKEELEQERIRVEQERQEVVEQRYYYKEERSTRIEQDGEVIQESSYERENRGEYDGRRGEEERSCEREEDRDECRHRKKHSCERQDRGECHGKCHGDCHGHCRRSCNDDASDWDPVGTYAAGDRVRYHGRVYVCLQGHSSNPTWAPDVAHSLWQVA